jgi:hypothetical protein
VLLYRRCRFTYINCRVIVGLISGRKCYQIETILASHQIRVIRWRQVSRLSPPKPHTVGRHKRQHDMIRQICGIAALRQGGLGMGWRFNLIGADPTWLQCCFINGKSFSFLTVSLCLASPPSSSLHELRSNFPRSVHLNVLHACINHIPLLVSGYEETLVMQPRSRVGPLVLEAGR